GVDLLRAAAALGPLDLAAASVQVTDNIAHILIGNDDRNLHDRLENDGIRLPHCLLEGHRTGDLKRHFRGVDLVIRTVEQRDLDGYDGITREHAGLHSTLNTLIDRSDELLGNRAANNRVDELVARTGLVGLNGDLDVTILALATGLTCILGLLIDLAAD